MPTITFYIYKPFLLRLAYTVFAMAAALGLQAQLCNGSLGDPVVDITFGTGAGSTGNFTPTSAYTYTSSTCPNDGFYTITSSTSGCFGSRWHTITSDHTGNGGNFMLVNASVTPGDFILANVDNLCPNTTYEFAAWIMNVLNFSGIRPNITFSIETAAGTVLQQYSTGDIIESPAPIWKQYGFFFTTPATNVPIVLRMTNNAPGGNGNDLALDDITFRPCGAATITSFIQGYSDTVNICEGNNTSYTFNATVTSGYTNPVFVWQVSTDLGNKWNDIAGATSLSYLRQPTGTGTYWYRMTVTEATSAGIVACRIASNVVVINVHAKPLVNAGADMVLLAGTSTTLNGVVTGENPVYYWDPPDNLSDNKLMKPVASPVTDKTYTLYAATPFGCTNQDAMSIKVVAGIFVPNAFTPNNDGINDHWHIPFLDPLFGATVSVYNRFGQLVYYSQAAIVDWDGNYKGIPQSPGTYVFYIRFNNGYPDLKGSILLIR